MFLYTCGYFPDKWLKFLSLKFAPKLMLGCIVSNCGTQASKTVFRQISTRFTKWPLCSNRTGGAVKMTTGAVTPFDHCVQTTLRGGHFWPLLHRLAQIPMLSWCSPKSKQGIPTTPNVPEPLVFSGFPDILFMPFVSIKRFTFLCKRCLWYNSIFP